MAVKTEAPPVETEFALLGDRVVDVAAPGDTGPSLTARARCRCCRCRVKLAVDAVGIGGLGVGDRAGGHPGGEERGRARTPSRSRRPCPPGCRSSAPVTVAVKTKVLRSRSSCALFGDCRRVEAVSAPAGAARTPSETTQVTAPTRATSQRSSS